MVKIVKFLSHKYTNWLYFATMVVLSIMRGGEQLSFTSIGILQLLTIGTRSCWFFYCRY
ncbi:peptide pheromone precursor [Lactiplantibacillus plantarum]|nr:peptide pheromone precursor [Lactiplantibacillus plantarum]PKX59300.1 peptide pheromone precursor [Lactiplantibacillus plantarum]